MNQQLHHTYVRDERVTDKIGELMDYLFVCSIVGMLRVVDRKSAIINPQMAPLAQAASQQRYDPLRPAVSGRGNWNPRATDQRDLHLPDNSEGRTLGDQAG